MNVQIINMLTTLFSILKFNSKQQYPLELFPCLQGIQLAIEIGDRGSTENSVGIKLLARRRTMPFSMDFKYIAQTNK